MSQVNLKKQTAASTTTPPTGYVGMYFDSTAGVWKYLDDTGTSNTFNSTVTSVSVTSANGLAGSVANATTTPAITLSTSITGILQGNGTAISAASTIGSGSVVLATSPTLTTPNLGTPSTLVGTNITGTASGLTAGTVTTNANLTGTVVTSSGNATSITTNSITNAMRAQMAANTIKGNNTGGTANEADLTATQTTAMLNVSTQLLQGLQSATDKKKQDNFWYNAVADLGLDSTGSVDGLAAINAFLATIPDSSTIYFPKGTYKISGTIAIPSGKHLTFKGDGPFKSTISTTSATLDMITVGDWYTEFRDLTFATSVTRTAGYAINGGANVYLFVYNCQFTSMFNGLLTNGTLCGIAFSSFTNTVNFSIQCNGANVNSFIETCTFDCAPASVAHLEINQCGSLLISNCDIIRATNNLRINPTSPNGAFAIYAVNTFFDTAAGSSVKFQGSGNIQRTKFVNCWFSGSVNGCEFASTATILPTAIDFINCDIYSNSANGVLGTAVQDVAFSNCRIAGNVTAGIALTASANAVTKLNVQNNTIGPTGNIGGNGTGILINAGTYGGYIITGNNVAGNVTANITDNGVVSGQNQKQIQDNIGHLLAGKVASIVAATAGINTTETIIAGGLNILPLPANSPMAGTAIRCTITGACTATAAVANTFRLRLGTAGTIADTQIASVAMTGATGTGIAFKTVIELTFRTVGAAGTLAGSSLTINGAATGIVAAVTNIQALTVAAPNTTTANYLSLTFQSAAATSTVTFQTVQIEVL